MKSNIIRSILAVAILALAAISFSSCNRGYGCPTNFSISSVTSAVLSAAACE